MDMLSFKFYNKLLTKSKGHISQPTLSSLLVFTSHIFNISCESAHLLTNLVCMPQVITVLYIKFPQPY